MGSLIKKELRKQLLDYRRLISADLYNERNTSIIKQTEALIFNEKAKVVHLFLAMKRNVEPDLGALLPQLWRKHIQLVTTKTDFKTRSITHHPIYAHTAINVSDKGIPEPVIEETANLDSIDIIFVPLLAFDRQGHRIGYGGGFYDQVLSDLPSRTLKIGLSLSGGLDAFNFVEEHDVALDRVLTPFESIEIK